MQAPTSLLLEVICINVIGKNKVERAASCIMQCNSGPDLCLTDSDLRDGGRNGPNYMVVKRIYF